MRPDTFFARIIRRACAVAALCIAGCATVEGNGGATRVVPVFVTDYDSDVVNREGTSFYNPRWSFDPDSHPAVRRVPGRPPAYGAYPSVSTQSAAEARADGQVAGAALGALAGAQAGNRAAGIVVGSAVGALAGGRMADPCTESPNLGTVWGTVVGAWFGSLFGGGRGRDFWTAVGAAGGAVRGTELGGDGRRCR
jgi:outer membrane lipoprotein SlyB